MIWPCGYARSPANAIYRTRNRSCSISPDDMRVGPITWTATLHSSVRNSARRISRSNSYVSKRKFVAHTDELYGHIDRDP